MAQVARQRDSLNPYVISGKTYQYLGRTVRAAIIDKDDLQACSPSPR
jgi:hypothetical protein